MRLNPDTTQASFSSFQFSAVRPEKLGASEYTLATIVIDRSGTTGPFADLLFELKKRILAACRRNARAENVLLRVVEFSTKVEEVHGFLPLSQINAADYKVPDCLGNTALYDAVFSAVGATSTFAQTLSGLNYLVNGLVFIVTDGDDNASRYSVADVRAEIKKAVEGEQIESLMTILVALNANRYEPKLRAFAADVAVTQYVDAGDASESTLAKVANLASQSISSQSQSIGNGGPSQVVTF